MTTPPAVSAVTTRLSGMVSRTTASEWYRVGGELFCDPGEELVVRVTHARHFAVHQFRGVGHRSAEGLRDGLVAEADPEQRNPVSQRNAHHGDRDSGGRWRTGSRRDQHAIELGDELFELTGGDLVVANHSSRCPELLQVSVQGVDETVVVVDNEDAGHVPTVTSCAGSCSATQGYTYVMSAYTTAARATEQHEDPEPRGAGEKPPEDREH